MSKETAPPWLVKRYMKLWGRFKDKSFSFEDARKRLYKLLSLEEVMKKTAEKAISVFKTDSKEASSNQINVITDSVIHGDVKNIKNGEENKN